MMVMSLRESQLPPFVVYHSREREKVEEGKVAWMGKGRLV